MAASERTRLREDSVPLLGVLAQSVATIGPSFAIFLGLSIVAGISGNGTWLTFVIATVVILLVTSCVIPLTRRFRTSGGLYSLAASTGGPVAAVFAGWATLLFYVVLGVVAFTGIGLVGARFAALFHADIGQAGTMGISVVGLLLATVFTYEGVEVSAKLMFYVELLSLLAIGALMLVGILHAPDILDSRQLSLTGATPSTVVDGAVLAIASYAGFESATTLGQEAKNPHRSIAVAVLASVLVVGLFFIGSSYVLVLGFHDAHQSLGASADPLTQLSAISGVRWLGDIVVVGVLVGAFSLGIAVLTATARVLMTLSLEGLLPRYLRHVSPTRDTPTAALGTLATLYLLVVIGLWASGRLDIVHLGYAGTLFGYGAVLLYIVICLSYIRYRRSSGALRVQDVVRGTAGAGALVFVVYKAAVPAQPAPYDYVLYTFFGVVVVAAIHSAILVARRSAVLGALGSSGVTVAHDTIQGPVGEGAHWRPRRGPMIDDGGGDAVL